MGLMLPIYSASNSFAADANSWQMLTQTLLVPLPIWVQNIIWRKHTGWEVGLWFLLLRTRSAEKMQAQSQILKDKRKLAENWEPQSAASGQDGGQCFLGSAARRWPVQWGRVSA